jgi:hypothetical protein
MLALLLAVASALTPSPKPCPADLVVQNPRLKVVRATDRSLDDYVVTVDVTNRGRAAQTQGVKQHLELLQRGKKFGTQSIPQLAPGERYAAAFRVSLPHARKPEPFPVAFHYVLDSQHDAARDNCVSANDRVSATL